MPWALQDAKNRFSEVVRQAQRSGPQIITVRGKESVVVLSIDEYRKTLKGEHSLFEFMQKSPWADLELDTERSAESGREVEL